MTLFDDGLEEVNYWDYIGAAYELSASLVSDPNSNRMLGWLETLVLLDPSDIAIVTSKSGASLAVCDEFYQTLIQSLDTNDSPRNIETLEKLSGTDASDHQLYAVMLVAQYLMHQETLDFAQTNGALEQTNLYKAAMVITNIAQRFDKSTTPRIKIAALNALIDVSQLSEDLAQKTQYENLLLQLGFERNVNQVYSTGTITPITNFDLELPQVNYGVRR